MEKTVIGLNLDNHKPAAAASLVSAIALFLPYARLESRSISAVSAVAAIRYILL